MSSAQESIKTQTLHLSPLLRKVELASGQQDPLACLKQLAVERGCEHYRGTFTPPEFLPPDMRQLASEELGVALCLPHFGHEPNSLRIAAEVISAHGVSFKRLAHLAAQERCVREAAYIARCGQTAEPGNSFWSDLLASLPKEKARTPVQHMPHWTRFVILGGMNRKGDKQMQWLRPASK